MNPTCQTCRFRIPDSRPEYENCGHCCRFPPQVIVWTAEGYSGAQFEQHYPWMNADEFCGEHQPKEQANAD